MTPKSCPNCKSNLESQDIYEYYLNEYKDGIKALESASFYGWKPEKPCCFSRCIGIYDMDRDVTSHWQCPDCKHKWERKR